MKEAVKTARDLIKTRTEAREALAKKISTAKAEMEGKFQILQTVNAALSFEEYTEAKHSYEDAKAYYEMLISAQKDGLTATAEDKEAFLTICEELHSYYDNELNEAVKKAEKPVNDLLELLAKKDAAQGEYIALAEELAKALNIPASVNHAMKTSVRSVSFTQPTGALLAACKKFKEVVNHD